MSAMARQLASLYRKSHDLMRSVDGLQPQEAFDELLKYLLLKESADEQGFHFPALPPPILGQNIVALNRNLINALRKEFKRLLESANSWSTKLWQDRSFHLTDAVLLGIHDIFEPVDFSKVAIDTRSAALSEFISVELRKGLGIFPTPDGVAEMIVEVASPNPSNRVLDPACGTGTFLIKVLRRWMNGHASRKDFRIWGIDKSDRMLLISELNLGHLKGVQYERASADSLYRSPASIFDGVDSGFDCILTNPPFGVDIDRDTHDMTRFSTCRNLHGCIVKCQQSEVIFIEQCIQYLKPGGLLGIVLPRSVVTNTSLHAARQAINHLGFLETIVNLPPETFCVSGTQTSTVILFLRRFKSKNESTEKVRISVVDIDNVGFDSTGRSKDGSQLGEVANILRSVRKGHITSNIARLLPPLPKCESLVRIPDMLSGRLYSTTKTATIPLGEIVEFAGNGRTPGRANYSSDGLFLVKVGNLSGQGISWKARDRNFIAGKEAEKRISNPNLMLQRGDILLTSSAHSPIYIAKKVDVVISIPDWVGGHASFVGEVLMLRLKECSDPFVMLAYLRLPSTQKQIQSLIRGQTAHLHPKDILEMRVPKSIVDPPRELQEQAEKTREEAELAEKLNCLTFAQRQASTLVETLLLG